MSMTEDFFRNRLDKLIDLRHLLAVLSIHLKVSQLYLQHTFKETDEDVIQRWGETRQYFSGNEYFEHRRPCDPTSLVKFRKLLVEEGVEELLARTIEVAVTLKLIAKKEFSCIIVDSTVQEKPLPTPQTASYWKPPESNWLRRPRPKGSSLSKPTPKKANHGHLKSAVA